MVKGRWLAQNFPSLGSAILEQADYACGTWIPEFLGVDQEWGELAAHWLIDWEKIMDITGLLDGDGFRDQLIASSLIDGELGVLLTESLGGFPQIQVFRSHRIGCNSESIFNTKKHKVVDGVLMNRFRAPVGYVLDTSSAGQPTLIPAKSFILAFQPLPGCADQVRGLSWLGSSADDWEDLDESRRFELSAQKALSRPTFIEYNETGEIDPTKRRFQTSTSHDSDTGDLTEGATFYADDQYFAYKAGTGSRLESFKYDRPGQNVQKYQAMVEMHGFRGIGWSRHFTLDPSTLGGATMRVEVDRITRTIQRRQKLVSRVMRRIHVYALSKAISLGILPDNDQFWMWSYQTPDMPTADRKYESDIAVQENNAGFATLDEIAGRRGKKWQKTQDQRILEASRMRDRVQEVFGIELDPVQLLFLDNKMIENRPETGPANQPDESQPQDTNE